MNSFKKKILTGLLGGAILLTGTAAWANPSESAHEQENFRHEEAAANIGGWAKYLNEKYGVDKAQVEKALNDGVHVEDARTAAILAKISGKSFSEVLAMRVDWQQVAEKLGITREQIMKFYDQERDEHFAQSAGIDVKTWQSLVKDGYDVRDIDIAGKIAKAAGKDIKSVLGKRKINNSWEDVAKSFGVDMQKIMTPPHHRDR